TSWAQWRGGGHAGAITRAHGTPRHSVRYKSAVSTRSAKAWWRRLDSNLSRFAGVSGAEARRRNPERSEGSPAPQPLRKYWWRRLDSNLSRFAGVSGAGARRRNPERSEGSPALQFFVTSGGGGWTRT